MKNLEDVAANPHVSAVSKDQSKREYAAPRLIVHGTLREITRNVGVGFVDFPNGSSIAG